MGDWITFKYQKTKHSGFFKNFGRVLEKPSLSTVIVRCNGDTIRKFDVRELIVVARVPTAGCEVKK